MEDHGSTFGGFVCWKKIPDVHRSKRKLQDSEIHLFSHIVIRMRMETDLKITKGDFDEYFLGLKTNSITILSRINIIYRSFQSFLIVF